MLFIDIKYIDLVSPKLRNFKKKNTYLWNFSCPICKDSKRSVLKARGFIYKIKNNLNFIREEELPEAALETTPKADSSKTTKKETKAPVKETQAQYINRRKEEKAKQYSDDEIQEILKLLTVLAKISIDNILKNNKNG